MGVLWDGFLKSLNFFFLLADMTEFTSSYICLSLKKKFQMINKLPNKTKDLLAFRGEWPLSVHVYLSFISSLFLLPEGIHNENSWVSAEQQAR